MSNRKRADFVVQLKKSFASPSLIAIMGVLTIGIVYARLKAPVFFLPAVGGLLCAILVTFYQAWTSAVVRFEEMFEVEPPQSPEQKILMIRLITKRLCILALKVAGAKKAHEDFVEECKRDKISSWRVKMACERCIELRKETLAAEEVFWNAHAIAALFDLDEFKELDEYIKNAARYECKVEIP